MVVERTHEVVVLLSVEIVVVAVVVVIIPGVRPSTVCLLVFGFSIVTPCMAFTTLLAKMSVVVLLGKHTQYVT